MFIFSLIYYFYWGEPTRRSTFWLTFRIWKTELISKQGPDIVQAKMQCEEGANLSWIKLCTRVVGNLKASGKQCNKGEIWDKQFGKIRQNYLTYDVFQMSTNAKIDVLFEKENKGILVVDTLSKLFTLEHCASWSLSKCKTSDQSRWFRLM